MINCVKIDNANNYLNEQIQFNKNTVHFFSKLMDIKLIKNLMIYQKNKKIYEYI